MYSTKEAAEYLGMTVAGIKYHLYVAKDLKPDKKIGQALVFLKSTLDEFKKRK